VIHLAFAEKAPVGARWPTLGHGEDATAMQRVPSDVHAVAEGGLGATGLRGRVPIAA